MASFSLLLVLLIDYYHYCSPCFVKRPLKKEAAALTVGLLLLPSPTLITELLPAEPPIKREGVADRFEADRVDEEEEEG